MPELLGGLEAYGQVFSEKTHEQVENGSGERSHVERFSCTLILVANSVGVYEPEAAGAPKAQLSLRVSPS